MSTIKDFVTTMKTASDEKTKAYDTTATVTRIEGNTAWVHIPGGVDETPVKMTIKAKTGDAVQVRVSSGKAFLVGNATAPPTDDTRAIGAARMASSAEDAARIAHAAANDAQESADRAYTAAEDAQESANRAYTSARNASDYASRALGSLSTVQSVAETLTWITQHGTMTLTTDTEIDPSHVYFVQDSTGDYVVGNVHYSLVTEPNVDDLSTYYELTIDESLNNYVGTHLALTNEGLWLLPASSGTNKVLIATGAGSTYVAGTYIIDNTGGVIASFRADGATIGTGSTQIAHLGYERGTGLSGYSEAPFYTFGVRKAIEQYSSTRSYAVGDLCWRLDNQPTGTIRVAYRCRTAISSGETWNSDHWQQLGAVNGNYSVAEGVDNAVTGYMCHAEGKDNIVAGYMNLVQGEGNYTGYEAVENLVSGEGHTLWGSTHRNLVAGESHIVQYGAETPSDDNLVSGIGNKVDGAKANTVIGRYATAAIGDYSDPYGSYAFRIGKGTSDSARSDALKVDWNGNVDIASGAKYKINGTDLSASDVSAVALSDKYTRSSAGDLNWSSTTEGDAKVIAKSALAFWNGAYSGNSSNLSKCSTGNIIGSNGGTMTGQLKTSFNSSVATGSYGSSQTTVEGLADEVRLSSGCCGSASIGTAYTKNGVTIKTGWYNFLWIPHRSGGVNGSASGDNCNYGQLLMCGMNNANGRFIVRVSSASIQEVAQLITTVEEKDYVIETGTTNGWQYQKYKSGWIDAYRLYTGNLSNYATYNGFYAYSVNFTPPFTMANTAYSVSAEWYIGSGFAMPATTLNKSTTGFTVYALASQSGTQSVNLWVHLVGHVA